MAYNATLSNVGAILGGQGGDSGNGTGGGTGGVGVDTGGGVFTNTGRIVGGQGGAGAGAGGVGFREFLSTILDNAGLVQGGAAGSSSSYAYGGAGAYMWGGGTVINTGTIVGGGGAGRSGNGVVLTPGGLVANGSTTSAAALIEGFIGVYAGAGGAATVTSWGTIDGTGGVAVKLASSADRLIVERGSTWIGSIQGGGGTLELAAGNGTIAGLGATGTVSGTETMTFSGFGAYVLDKGGIWTMAGSNSLAAGTTLTDAGALTITGTITSAGMIAGAAGSKITLKKADIVGGALSSATTVSVAGAGNILDGTSGALTLQASLSLADKASLTLQGAVANSGTISLAGKTATTSLIIGKPGATLSGHGTVMLGGSALDILTGSATTATLTNVDNAVIGGGLIGNGKMTLVNQTAGIIEQTGSAALTVNTGTKAVTNAGTIAATGTGGLTITGGVTNTGLFEAIGGELTLTGKVTGAGHAVINAGTLYAASTFTEAVTFSGTTGELILGASQTYTGKITGFSATGATTLDLRDIVFVSAGEATFSGTTKGGVLTVTDGMHSAKISLVGDYSKSTWVASGDGFGGVTVVSPTAPKPQGFVIAMAGLGSQPGSATGSLAATAPPCPAPTLISPVH